MRPTRPGFNAYTRIAFCLLATLPVATGCTLLTLTSDMTKMFSSMGKPVSLEDIDSSQTASKTVLPPLRNSREAIQLDLFVVERPLHDPLMGARLWDEISEVGNLGIEVKQSIDANGFRIGNCSSSPPLALQKMCGLSSKESTGSSSNDNNQLHIRRIAVIKGIENEVQTNYAVPELTTVIDDHGHTREKTYQDALCKLRLNAEKLESGWVRVTFLPEIHHGENKYRQVPTADGNAWMGRTTQNIDPMFSQQFSIDLRKDEFAVITGRQSDGTTLGQNFFFVKQNDDWRFQRMLVVRVSRSTTVTATESTPL